MCQSNAEQSLHQEVGVLGLLRSRTRTRRRRRKRSWGAPWAYLLPAFLSCGTLWTNRVPCTLPIKLHRRSGGPAEYPCVIACSHRRSQLIASRSQVRRKNIMARMARNYVKPSRRTKKVKRRSCLRCDREFLSEGPHHRLCHTCRQVIAASPSPVEEYSVVPLRDRGALASISTARPWL